MAFSFSYCTHSSSWLARANWLRLRKRGLCDLEACLCLTHCLLILCVVNSGYHLVPVNWIADPFARLQQAARYLGCHEVAIERMHHSHKLSHLANGAVANAVHFYCHRGSLPPQRS